DQRYVQQLRSIKGVLTSHAVVIGSGEARFLDGNTAGISVVGSDAPGFVIGPKPEKIYQGNLNDLNLPEAVSAEFYNAKSWNTDLYLNKPIEINGKSATIKVITKQAQAFGGNYMYTNLANARYFGNVAPDKISMVALRLNQDANKKDVIAEINKLYPNL